MGINIQANLSFNKGNKTLCAHSLHKKKKLNHNQLVNNVFKGLTENEVILKYTSNENEIKVHE